MPSKKTHFQSPRDTQVMFEKGSRKLSKKAPRAVAFDLDGVLVDSLTAHLHYCRRIASDLQLNITIPSASAFKHQIISTGVTISPMFEFFRAVGFPDAYARAADQRYQAEFWQEPLRMFQNVPRMLHCLRDNQIQLGLVTANVRSVIQSTLGELLKLFNRDAIFANDDKPAREKDKAVTAAASAFQLAPKDVIFVGDQLADYRAAQRAGVQFIGVTYGWGISSANKSGFLTADSVSSLTKIILGAK